MSVKFSLTVSNQFLRHPLFTLQPTSSNSILTLLHSRFSSVGEKIIHSQNSIRLYQCSFFNSLQAIHLDSTQDSDIRTRFISDGKLSKFISCTFHALISVKGDDDETNGGAVYINGFPTSFSDCLFVGNTAVRGGACAFAECEIVLLNCNFSDNTATLSGGAFIMTNCKSFITNVIFVSNHAEGNAGCVFATKCVINADKIIMHRNSAPLVSAGFQLYNTRLDVKASQFSSQTVAFFGTSFFLSNSMVYCTECKFESQKIKKKKKSYFVADSNSTVSAKSCCFDCTADEVDEKIDASYIDMKNHYSQSSCGCQQIEAQHPYEIEDLNLTVKSSLTSRGFYATVISFIGSALVIGSYMVFRTDGKIYKQGDTK